jgi:acyl-CoA synthetase (AMP-forming)/AMP-acid ligase II/1-acyl-sn-glycerol-3-phosphate acyltransferase/acyl carrier protein
MLSTIIKRILGLRYRVSVSGLERIDVSRGVLILPNHPAEIDPVIVTTYLWDLLQPRPVVIEGMYNLPLLHPILRRIRAIPMADMEFDSGPYKRRRIERTLDTIRTALEYGDNVLMYPSGRLSVTGVERIGGASGVHAILRANPQIGIAVVKVRGLYGSIFSKAVTGGTTPDVVTTLLKGLRIIAQNLLFLTPRRSVSVSVDFNPPDFPRSGDALTINKYLEGVYNAPEPETPSLVSHSFFRHNVPTLPERRAEQSSLESVSPTIRDAVYQHVARAANVPLSTLTDSTQLGDDLGLDSLTVAELLLWLDREFEASDVELSELVTVGSLIRAAIGELGSSTPKPEYQIPTSWTKDLASRPLPELSPASTIAEAFLIASSRMGNHAALGDERSGVLTWSELRVRALVLARRIAESPGTHVGILLPASVASSTVTLAAILAGKIPVFLNWTAGKRSLLHACEATGLVSIYTSERFLDIVPTELDFLEGRFVLLEQLAASLSLKEKARAKRMSAESTGQILKAFGLTSVKSDDAAVVLFTSGSEALPKGVPLSHKNILSNVRGVLNAFQITSQDVLLGFLPPFHSFGLTVCSLLPLVTGLRVAYHPNPNESRKIAKAIGTWGASLAAGTPTFLRSILKAGSPSQFSSMRALVSGAERAPQELFELASSINPAIEVLEGYGITECSPVVSVSRPHEERIGVGRPVEGVSITIVHPETKEPVSDGEQGLILIRGTSVFSGYLDPSIDPFVTHGGQTWYNSGDLGRIDQGRLVITGRLKRFIKIAGEMISLGALEEALQKRVPSTDGAPSVAVLAQGTEGDGRPKLVAFAAGALSLESANVCLRESGFPHIVHIAEVRELKTLPVLGTGKTDYQGLKAMLAS